eukprot:7385042-Alexandrium_andersonii.AAC.1
MISSLSGPRAPVHSLFNASVRLGPALDCAGQAAHQQARRSNKWNTTSPRTNTRSHSTYWLTVSASSALATLDGRGFTQAPQLT